MHLFIDLEHVVRRTQNSARTNVLAVIENPAADEIENFRHPDFVFRGFDLLERCGGDVSALLNCGLNCGGFDKAFADSELSACGLLTSHPRASKSNGCSVPSIPTSTMPTATSGPFGN